MFIELIFITLSFFGSTNAAIIPSKIALNWKFADSSHFELTHTYRWFTHDMDILNSVSISIEDAVFGKMVDVVVNRIVLK